MNKSLIIITSLLIVLAMIIYYIHHSRTTLLKDPLSEWINPKYLQPNIINQLQQLARNNLSTKSHQYLVLDNFFKPDKAKYLASLCQPFEEIEIDNQNNRAKSPATFAEIPANRAQELNTIANESYYKQGIRVDTYQPKFFQSQEWMNYLAKLVNAKVIPKTFKWQLRGYHNRAPGIFIHSDNEPQRSLLMLTYFNHNWQTTDGGLLQLWKQQPINPKLNLPVYSKFITHTNCDMLNNHDIFRLGPKGPGGTITLPETQDFHLADRIIPKFNRIFIANAQTSPVWHSVTPNQGRPRFCLQQWIT